MFNFSTILSAGNLMFARVTTTTEQWTNDEGELCEDIGMECPSCGLVESWGIDEQRHKFCELEFQCFIPDEQEIIGNRSIHKCMDCNEVFEVDWDYSGLLTEEQYFNKYT